MFFHTVARVPELPGKQVLKKCIVLRGTYEDGKVSVIFEGCPSHKITCPVEGITEPIEALQRCRVEYEDGAIDFVNCFDLVKNNNSGKLETVVGGDTRHVKHFWNAFQSKYLQTHASIVYDMSIPCSHIYVSVFRGNKADHILYSNCNIEDNLYKIDIKDIECPALMFVILRGKFAPVLCA
jgi:acylphosphatase